MQRLHTRGAKIEVATSGNGLWYFSNKPEVSRIHEISSFAYGSKDGEISITRTFGSVAQMFGTIRRNTKVLSYILDEANADAVVLDSDYNFLPIKRRKLPLVALNNADFVWQSYFQMKNRPVSIRAQFYGVEMLDYGFHRIIPDLVLSPTLISDAGTSTSPSNCNIVRVGPIVRDAYRPLEMQRPPQRAVVMLSGSVFGTAVNFKRLNYPLDIDVIGREQPKDLEVHPQITFHGKIKDTFPLLETADIAVINGGFSAVSEMFFMQKPMVVVPVPRHSEQWVNAQLIENLGVGINSNQLNFENIMLKAIEQIDLFDLGYKDLAKIEDGASQAAEAILNIVDTK